MAENARSVSRRRKSVYEKALRKKQAEAERAKTRISIGEEAFERWRALKDRKRLRTDAMVALFLLDSYEKHQNVTSLTPHKQEQPPPKQEQPPPIAVSSISEESDHNGCHLPIEGVQPLEEGTGAEMVVVLEGSMQGYGEEEEGLDSPDEDELNDPRNTVIEMDEAWADPRFCDCADNSDEEEVPFLHLRVDGASSKPLSMEQLRETTVDETVLDVEIPDPLDEETDVPDHLTIDHEDDLVEKKACIAYLENLNMLASYLQFPMTACNHTDKITRVKCSGRPPFQVEMKPRGTGVVFKWLCPFGHILWSWNSQPLLKCGMQGGDFMLSTNILLSGNNYRKVAFLYKLMQMGMVAESAFYKIQDAYCIEPVAEFWQKIRAGVLDRLRGKDEVVVLGDCRLDSPGQSAQYCTYTTMEQESRDIVHIVSADKPETNRSSVILEKECFVRTMDALLPEIDIAEVVTDAHTQISALLDPENGKYRTWGLKHSLDIWHVAKNLGKKLRQAGMVKDQSELLPWIKDIVNHFWYAAKQASSVEDFKRIWHAVVYHVRNQHQWAWGSCDHNPVAEGTQTKEWIKNGSPAHYALASIVLDVRWLKNVEKFINFRRTSDFENFQNHILMYAGKRYSYTPAVYRTRTLLAAIDYNYHNCRVPVRNEGGHKIHQRYYNCKSQSWTVCTKKEKKDYSYIPDLQRTILAKRLGSGRGSGRGLPRKQTLRPDDPQRLGLLAPLGAPSTSELVRTHVTRGECVP